MLSLHCGTKTQQLVEDALNACKLSISGVDQPADVTQILKSSSSDLTQSTRSLLNQINASTLLLATPLPSMMDSTIAKIAHKVLPALLITATNVPSELESAQDVKPTSFSTEYQPPQHAPKSETATSATMHGPM